MRQCDPVARTPSPDRSRPIAPILTDFTHDNLGVPRNLNIPGVMETSQDLGLGGRPDVAASDPDGLQIGKFKVPTLRNVGLTAPYGHSGVFRTLQEIVHFYSTWEVLGACADNNDPGFGVTCWPPPEVPQNLNRAELGNLHLTAEEEARIVDFLMTLSDRSGQGGGMNQLPRPPMPPFP